MFRYIVSFLLCFSIYSVNGQDDNCINVPSMKLCQQPHCPTNYHICNVLDQSMIRHNMQIGAFSELTNVYYTDITLHGEKCANHNDELRFYIGQQEPIQEDVCVFDNIIAYHGEGVRIGKCMFCMCHPKESKCVNMCAYSRDAFRVRDFIDISEVSNQRIGSNKELSHTNSADDVYCSRLIHNINQACCADHQCLLKHCISCESYGEIEKCMRCESGYYFYKDFNTRCYGLEEISDLCYDAYVLDEETQQFDCLKCNNGIVQYDNSTNTMSCGCNQGYFGSDCSKEYSVIYCSSNGAYDESRRICTCNDMFSGDDCSQYEARDCQNGKYNAKTETCVCEPGFVGESCEERVSCVHGDVFDRVCMCHDGFSGSACDIYRFESSEMRREKELLLSDYYKQPCKHGVLNNETNVCVCYSGFSGLDCSNAICKYGRFDYEQELCVCSSGYYGEYCQYSCAEKCNYNGNMCNLQRSCQCDDEWYGDYCEKIRIHSDKITIADSFVMNIRVSDSTYKENRTPDEDIDIVYDSSNDSSRMTEFVDNHDIDIEIISCFSDKCVPFRLVYQVDQDSQINNSVNAIRSLQDVDTANVTYIELIMDQLVLNESANEAIYVYPNNDYNTSYYGGTNNVRVALTPTTRDNFFYIESRFISTSTYDEESDDTPLINDDDVTNDDTEDETESDQRGVSVDEQQSNNEDDNSFIHTLTKSSSIGIMVGVLAMTLFVGFMIKKQRRVRRRGPPKLARKNDKDRIIFTTNDLYKNKGARQAPIFNASNRKIFAPQQQRQMSNV